MPRLTRKGQVTIPHKIRAILEIRAGDEIAFEVDHGRVLVKKKRASSEVIKEYVGYLSHQENKKTDEIVDALRGPGA